MLSNSPDEVDNRLVCGNTGRPDKVDGDSKCKTRTTPAGNENNIVEL